MTATPKDAFVVLCMDDEVDFAVPTNIKVLKIVWSSIAAHDEVMTLRVCGDRPNARYFWKHCPIEVKETP